MEKARLLHIYDAEFTLAKSIVLYISNVIKSINY